MQTEKDTLIIAAAGSGKTRHLVEEALRLSQESILVTTYTDANEAEIRKQFVAKCGGVPGNVKIQTWFSFLIQHGVKPFQGGTIEADIKGLLLVNEMSARGVAEQNAERYYLSPYRKVYSDKLWKLVFRCNGRSDGRVIDRLSRVYSHIFVDEVQDLAGYDLDILRLLFGSQARVLLVGDPRQVVYLTHHERRLGKYSWGKIRDFVTDECKGFGIVIDEERFCFSYRSHALICQLADRLYPGLKRTVSRQDKVTSHDGVFVVAKKNAEHYLRQFRPTQLRWSRKTPVCSDLPAHNFGEAKGLTFDRVFVYPTRDMVEWIGNQQGNLADGSRAKFYVALTRARHSVAICCDFHAAIPDGVSRWP